MKHMRDIYKGIVVLTQFGISLIMPLMLCVGLCWLLTAKCGIGYWIFVPGFILGLGGSVVTAYKFYLSVERQENRETEKRNKDTGTEKARTEKIFYNRHS